ncbi:uncharacterized protein LOC128676327 [Plodia interpunctella]|uniref:uncharacterized protein LOC128676327 n=1 Tax=Plodia interpunctella TaxID=58824 RepID=UPI002367E44B|nr:uncharacterized protein LOC128676327 [Plodia interpunctella]
MVQSQFSLSWNSYKNSICNGFTSFQQNGELVDMTLAADGHFVKVHQVLLALASPYLKDLITSAPCQHPVLFLNNVSHKNMSLILEYIYTGEVLVPVENMTSFAEAARGLHIKGLENLTNHSLNIQDRSSYVEEKNLGHVTGVKRIAVPTSDGVEEVAVPAAARKIYVKQDLVSSELRTHAEPPAEPLSEHAGAHDSDDDCKPEISASTPKDIKATANLQYTVSIRGALQVLLNRYMYNLQSARGALRRWRCIDYRNHKCMAFLVTRDNVVVNRANLHNHGFHDKKILAKINKKCVFSAIDDVVKNYKERESEESKTIDSDTTMDEGFSAIDSFH